MGLNQYLDQFDKWLTSVFKGAPKLPKGFVKFLVSVLPWLALLGGVMGVIGILGSLSVGGLAAVVMGSWGYRWGMTYWFSLGLMVVITYLSFKAFGLLKVRKLAGWKLSWYVMILSLVNAVLMLDPMGLVGVVVGFYFLYQIKGEYK